jgi:SAM-dependent methyltransferase
MVRLTRLLPWRESSIRGDATICWGTRQHAERLGCAVGTRYWAHAWIRRHMERLPLSRTTVVDAGSGLSNPLLDWYRPLVHHAFLIDFLAEPGPDGNCTVVRADLEKGIPLPDESVDLVTSASSIEHLSASGQTTFMAEAERVLRPGGRVVMTVSHVFGLNEHTLRVLAADPVLAETGCPLTAPLNLRRLLQAAPGLRCPGRPRLDRFPGYEGFFEDAILGDDEVIFDRVGSYADVRCRPETDALGLRWAEIGLYLVKR